MITEYVLEALSRAKFQIIKDEESYYGEVPELKGVWATGKTLEECRKYFGGSDRRVACCEITARVAYTASR